MHGHLHLHTSSSAQELIAEFITSVHDGKDIMCDEIVLTPEHHTGLYLKRCITEQHSICSGIQFDSLSSYIEKLRCRYNASHRHLSRDPWEQEELSWRILETLEDEEFFQQAELCELRRWLGRDESTAHYEDNLKTLPDGYIVDISVLQRLDFSDIVLDYAAYAVLDLAQKLPFGSRWPVFESEGKNGKPEYRGGEFSISPENLVHQFSRILVYKLQEQPIYTELQNEFYQLSEGDFHAWCKRFSHEFIKLFDEALVDQIAWGDTSSEEYNPVIRHDFAKSVAKNFRINEQLDELALRIKSQLKDLLRHIDDYQENWSFAFCEKLIVELSPEPSSELSDARMRKSRSLAWAQKSATRFIEYAYNTPETLCAWAEGSAQGVSSLGFTPDDGLHKQFEWQCLLWKYLVERDNQESAPALDLARFIMSIEQLDISELLPKRIHLYGYSYLSTTEKLFLQHIAGFCELSIYVLVGQAGCNDSSPLNYWDKNRQGFIQWLNTELLSASPELSEASLPYHASTSFHACMGNRRQIEVLHDLVIQSLSEDPHLELEDIAVICPNTEEFVPLCASIMNSNYLEEHPIKRLNFWSTHHAEYPSSDSYRFIHVMNRLACGYVSYSSIKELLSIKSVSLALNLQEKALEAIFEMLRASQVNWAWDIRNPERQYLGLAPKGTWSYALRQLAAGLCLSDSLESLGVWSYSEEGESSEELHYLGDLGSVHIETLACLISFLEQLEAWCRKLVAYDNFLQCTHDITSWAESFEHAFLQWFKPIDDQELYIYQRTMRWLAKHKDENRACFISLEEWKQLCEQQFSMRSNASRLIPSSLCMWEPQDLCGAAFKQVFLLGLDNNCFPHQLNPDADNMLLWEKGEGGSLQLRRNHEGFFHPAYHERQQLLLTLCSAQKVKVIYSNRNDRTGQELEPALVIQDLMEELSGNYTSYQHPLFSFEEVKGTISSGEPEPIYSFDPRMAQKYEAYHGCVASKLEDIYHFEEDELRSLPATYDIAEISRCITAPLKNYCKSQFKLYFAQDEEENPDVLPSSTGLSAQLRSNFIRDHIKEAGEYDGFLFSNMHLQNLLIEELGLSKTALEQAGMLLVSKTLLTLYRIASHLNAQKASWMKEDMSYVVDFAISDMQSELTLMGTVPCVLGDMLASFTTSDKPKDSDVVSLAFNFIAYLAHQYLQEKKAVSDLDIPPAYAVYDHDKKTKSYPSLHAPSTEKDMRILLSWLMRMVRLYELSRAIALPVLHEGMMKSVANAVMQAEELSQDKKYAPFYDKAYFDFIYQRDTNRDFVLSQKLPQACLAYLFKGEDEYQSYLEETYKPSTCNDYVACLIWEPLVSTGVIREFV